MTRRNLPLPVILLLLVMHSSLLAGEKLTLDMCKDLALKNNVEVLNSREEVKAAKQVKRQAFTHYFPEISATGMALWANDPLLEFEMEGGNLPVYDGNPANLANPTEFAYFPGFSLSAGEEVRLGAISAVQPIFAGGRIFNGNRLAGIGYEAQNLVLDLKETEVLVNTEKMFWQIVSLDEKLKTITAYSELLENLEKQVQDAYDAGLVLKNDLLKVQLKRSEVQLNTMRLNNGRRLAMMAFCQSIGIEYNPKVGLEYSANGLMPEAPDSINHKEALSKRNEYQLLQRSEKAAHLQTSMAVGESMPTLAGGVSGFTFNVDDMDDINNQVAFLTLQVPISGWWGGSHKIAEQKAKERIAKNTRRDTEELLILDMQKSWQDLKEVFDQYQLSLQTKLQADENLRVTQDSYDNGMVTVSDLLEAQALQQEAKDSLIETQIDYRMKHLAYMKATARL